MAILFAGERLGLKMSPALDPLGGRRIRRESADLLMPRRSY